MMKRIHILSAAYVIFILFAISIANSGAGKSFFAWMKLIPYSDKVGHFILMGILALMINLSLKYRSIKVSYFSLPIGSLIVFALVTAEEFTQMANAHRTFDLMDLLADLLGIIFFTWLGKRFYQVEQAK